jgi:transposase
MAIWQDLVSDYGFRGGYQSVRRFAYKLRGAQVPPARAVILTAPGEEGQVDYGSGPMVREAKSGQYRRTRLFVLTLGYSHGCWFSVPARASGPSCTRRHFVD